MAFNANSNSFYYMLYEKILFENNQKIAMRYCYININGFQYSNNNYLLLIEIGDKVKMLQFTSYLEK